MEENSLTQRLRGRAAYLRDNGEVKSPDLMEDAADEIERLQRIIDSRPAIPEAAPQPQADGRGVERLFEIVRAIERAFQELPENFAINIKLANGVAAGFLSGPGLTERRIANGDFVEDINAAIDAAIAAAKGSNP